MMVVIVDDEILERKAMKKFIEETFSNIQVAGEAANGRIAIELAASLQPDVMIMDIKMPGIDGLEAIRLIRKDYPEIKFIMVSAYESFDYAKEAMKEGVKEYILKPSRKQETIEALLRVQKEIEQEHAEKDVQSESSNLLKQHFFMKAINSHEGEELDYLKDRLFPNMEEGLFIVMDGVFELKEVIATLQMFTEWDFLIEKIRGEITVLFILKWNGPDLKAEILNLARKLCIHWKEEVRIGIGFPVSQVRELKKSYQQAFKAYNQLKNQEGKIEYGFPVTETKGKPSLEHLLRESLLRGDSEKVVFEAEAYFAEVDPDSSSVMDSGFLIKRKLEEIGVMIDFKPLTSIKGKAEWVEFLRVCTVAVMEFRESEHHVHRAKEYINQHYQGSISLEEVAALVELSPTYFTKLFKEETGQTFIDYLTEIRMNKAKELLQTREYSLKEITYLVGYKDPNYFSRVFKKVVGCAPKRFL
ncbi:response regulator [Metabacillus arenae]|uniref:Response regulator n=1 Tax=Metabacillus arenae TaxID=2771434 RepID=A0A926NLH3_9BACI|nr:response regulator [Metabacillus arenae]MBD1382890.1 response regulator [Metabacillus arenae]